MTDERQYLELLHEARTLGTPKGDRTDTGTRSLFGRQMRFDLAQGFPLLTTKRVFFRGVVAELLWMLSGETNIQPLQAQGVRIWDDWADPDGDLGPVYGAQWRSWPGRWHADEDGEGYLPIDQIREVVGSLQADPDSRRHIVTAWNPAELDEMALPPCHLLFQFYSRPLNQRERARIGRAHGYEAPSFGTSSPEGWDRLGRPLLDDAGVPTRALDCQLYQRSGDLFLGLPFNIASYSLLTHLMAQVTGHLPGEFIHTLGDAHLYENHVEQAREQLAREPVAPPRLRVDPVADIDDYSPAHIHLEGYDPHPSIKAPVAV